MNNTEENSMSDTLTTKEHTEAHGDKIKGYRKLSDDEIELINRCKAMGQSIDSLIDDVRAMGAESDDRADGCDQRWLAMAKTDLQVGIMKLVRSIAKPQGF